MIRLIFSTESIKSIRRMGLKQSQRERLRWSDQHPASSHGLGVLLRGQSDQLLDGDQFKKLVEAFGAHIECSTELEHKRVRNALAWGALGLPEDTVRLREPTQEKA
jgi:hypothetical protein